MSTFQTLALLIGVAAVVLTAYGFGYVDGRDSMRSQKGDK